MSFGCITSIVMDRDTGRTYRFGLFNKRSYKEEGLHVLTAAGGKPRLSAQGARRLSSEMDTQFHFGYDTSGMIDAQFSVAKCEMETAYRIVKDDVQRRAREELIRELREEFCLEYFGKARNAILEESDFKGIDAKYLGFTRQQPRGRAEGNDTFYRGFFSFKIVVPTLVLKAMKGSRYLVEMLTDSEVLTTNGGMRRGQSNSGALIGGNVF